MAATLERLVWCLEQRVTVARRLSSVALVVVPPMTLSTLHDGPYRDTDPRATLAAATNELYQAFSDHGPRGGGASCAHCVSGDEARQLRGHVVVLPPALVSRFLAKAGTTWGDARDVQRIAPRALVLSADNSLTVSRELLWDKLRCAGWPEWPAAEVDAVRRFLRAEWGRLLRSPSRPSQVAHRWLAEVAPATPDIGGYLAGWHDAMGSLTGVAHQAAAVGHLVELLSSSPLRPDLPDSLGDVFGGDPAIAKQVRDWLVGPATLHELERASARAADTPVARSWSVALERLRRFRAAADH